MMANISRLEQDIVDDHRLLIHTSSGTDHSFPYFPFPFSPSVVDRCPTLPVTETAMVGGAWPKAGGRRGPGPALANRRPCSNLPSPSALPSHLPSLFLFSLPAALYNEPGSGVLLKM